MADPAEEMLKGLDGAAKAQFARKTYALLGLAAGCGEAAVKKAYKKASLQYHPDKQRGKTEAEQETAASMFLKVKEAYETLSNESTRNDLDAAVAGAARAKEAHAKRAERMDATRRRFKDELERREAAAAGGPSKAAAPPSSDAAQAARRANAGTAEAQARRDEAVRHKRKAERAAETASAKEAREAKKRRSLKVTWARHADPGTLEAVGGVEAVERGSSSRAATLVFETDDLAVAAAIDEEFGSRFTDVRLATTDAWERVRAAVAARSEADRASAPELRTPKRGDDAASVAARTAERERLLREAEGTPVGDDGAPRKPREAPAAKRRRVAAAAAALDAAGLPAAFAAKEAAVLGRLLAAAGEDAMEE